MPVTICLLLVHGNQECLGVGPVCDMGLPRFHQSATVFYKHKYISNPTATPANAIIAAAGNLITVIKGHIPQRLQEPPLSELTHLITIFSEAAATPQIEIPQLVPTARSQTKPQQRRSPRLTTKITKDDVIVASPHPPLLPPVKLPIP